jgi:prepilin-type N-terminal cleavage/methylation domain-containing protein
MKKINSKNKGFTLIETLVAITILMISIVGPLTISQKSLMAATLAKDQVIASFLAQDIIEEIKNDRDILLKERGVINQDWLNDFNENLNNCTAVCPLFIQQDGTYGTDGSSPNVISKFSKKVSIVADPSSENINEFIVTAIIYWNTGSIENQVKISNVIYNIQL